MAGDVPLLDRLAQLTPVPAADAASLRIRGVLDELQKKYGPLPSLLATRADYVDGLEEREYWLMAAYEQAQARGDLKNRLWIASSLASLHLEEAGDPVTGEHWLRALEGHLGTFPDESEHQEAIRLGGILEELRTRPQNKQMQRTRRG